MFDTNVSLSSESSVTLKWPLWMFSLSVGSFFSSPSLPLSLTAAQMRGASRAKMVLELPTNAREI